MPIFKSLLMSAKTRHYNPICEDSNDSKIPLHNDDAFQQGIQFQVKFIGSLEVPKPTSRAEIVAAMRRIRYEFKARSIKKHQVDLAISVNGIQVTAWKKKMRDLHSDENRTVLLQYPIYRVFYVSHDSQDLKIFSFIVRDYNNNAFRCHVFKESKKNEAMRIVRTIGQAFEVCHKLSLQDGSSPSSPASHQTSSDVPPMDAPAQEQKTPDIPIEPVEKIEAPMPLAIEESTSTPIHRCSTHLLSETTLKHQMQFMQEQLQHMQHESELAFAQIKMIKDQLSVEAAARLESQRQNKELLDRNRGLLTHIQQLLVYINELEKDVTHKKNVEPVKSAPSRPTDLLLHPSSFSTSTTSASTNGTSHEQDLSSDSPDSGKGKEMSSESISDPSLTHRPDQQLNSPWNDKHPCLLTPDDTTMQSISLNASVHAPDAYPSSSSSCSSITNSKSGEPYLCDHIAPTGSASFTNSAFTPSPLQRFNQQSDPFREYGP